jgi:alcohol dehydrogenase (cytochrome c)
LVDNRLGYSVTAAPIAVKDKVIVGVGGGELGIRGFIAAFQAKTGKEIWRFYTIPGPGEPGHETWQPCPSDARTYCDPEAWKHGGGSVWVTGSFDPELNLDVTDSGILTSAIDLLVTGGREGYLQILDARTGTLLWKSNLGAQMLNGPITYEVNGKQYIAALAGLSLFSFTLPD